jgi:cytochrome d ubiquinol oxidase subunit II
MIAETVVAGLTGAALIAYAVLGGADFGGGIWDLFARGPRAVAQRRAIADAMGPVWEANHVWLIFVIVLVFSCFPAAFEVLSIVLFVPLHLVLLGIVLRGAAFVFRAYARGSAEATGWAVVFRIGSVITPPLLGMSLGAMSSGMIHLGQDNEISSAGGLAWLSPVALAMGALALGLSAYLAAVFLANETQAQLREDFRLRALIAGTVVVGLSVLTLPLLRSQAPHLWDGLMGGRATLVFAAGIVAALASGFFLLLRWHRPARIAAVLQIACLVAGWGLAQYPYIIHPDLTLHAAAAPEATLRFVLLTAPIGLAFLVPALWILFAVFKGEHFGREQPDESQGA